MNYVLGFAFNEDNTKLALIRKNRPEWQAGKLNGIGGKVESYDKDSMVAMHREFVEECGLSGLKWSHYAMMSGSNWQVDVFASYGNKLTYAMSATDEVVEIHNVDDILTKREKTMSNLPWLIALALDEDTQKGAVHYSHTVYGPTPQEVLDKVV